MASAKDYAIDKEAIRTLGLAMSVEKSTHGVIFGSEPLKREQYEQILGQLFARGQRISLLGLADSLHVLAAISPPGHEFEVTFLESLVEEVEDYSTEATKKALARELEQLNPTKP